MKMPEINMNELETFTDADKVELFNHLYKIAQEHAEYIVSDNYNGVDDAFDTGFIYQQIIWDRLGIDVSEVFKKFG
jgi:hypothetical protein